MPMEFKKNRFAQKPNLADQSNEDLQDYYDMIIKEDHRNLDKRIKNIDLKIGGNAGTEEHKKRVARGDYDFRKKKNSKGRVK